MENLESSILNLISSIDDINKKNDIWEKTSDPNS